MFDSDWIMVIGKNQKTEKALSKSSVESERIIEVYLVISIRFQFTSFGSVVLPTIHSVAFFHSEADAATVTERFG